MVARAARILVVDDDDDARALVIEALSKDGYEVRATGDGRWVLENLVVAASLLRTCMVDLLVLDVWMPEMNGLTLLAALRSTGVKVPVLMITAHYTGAIAARAKQLGAAGVLEKPFEPDDLRSAVMKLIGDERLRHRHVQASTRDHPRSFGRS